MAEGLHSSSRCNQNTKRKTITNSRRKQTFQYFFTVQDARIKVCKAVFLSTLGIGEKTVAYTLAHRTNNGQAATDKRGKHSPGIKITDSVRETVRQHINSFPLMESHYAKCKYRNSKKFLQKDLTIREMYRLYSESFSADRVFENYYRDVLHEDFPNIAFHKPKKDPCNYCVCFQNMTKEEKPLHENEYLKHHQKEETVRNLKLQHKQLSKCDPTVAAVTFDLEPVLLSPKLNASSLFYRRKLTTYNLTIYRLDNGKVLFHMWHEGQAGRGSCEIATCIFKFFNFLPCDVNRVILYSDACAGQNRNLSFSTICLSAVQAHTLEIMNLIYMESGHSQMECDSAHSTIESALKDKDIYCPADYFHIAAMARKQKPFQVELLSTSEVLDFKGFSKEIVRNRL